MPDQVRDDSQGCWGWQLEWGDETDPPKVDKSCTYRNYSGKNA
ncbi:hypothetical protein ACFLQV_02130 [Calditrichota bacterium]